MMRLIVDYPAWEWERFAPDAFVGKVGREMVVKIGDHVTTGTLIEATVAENGASVRFVIDGIDYTIEPPQYLALDRQFTIQDLGAD